jgi:hypothetical protein
VYVPCRRGGRLGGVEGDLSEGCDRAPGGPLPAYGPATRRGGVKLTF